MKVSIGIDMNRILARVKNLTASGITKSVKELMVSIDEKTPEDTGKLVGNNETKETSISGDTISGGIFNNTEYAKTVEEGLPWAHNYHKRVSGKKVTIFRSGQYQGKMGNRTFARARDEIEPDVVNNIKQALKGL